jgi:hypothetical protein
MREAQQNSQAFLFHVFCEKQVSQAYSSQAQSSVNVYLSVSRRSSLFRGLPEAVATCRTTSRSISLLLQQEILTCIGGSFRSNIQIEARLVSTGLEPAGGVSRSSGC